MHLWDITFARHLLKFLLSLLIIQGYSKWLSGFQQLVIHKKYTWDRSMCIFLFNRTTLQVFVTYLIGSLYVHPLWFYKHQHDNHMGLHLENEVARRVVSDHHRSHARFIAAVNVAVWYTKKWSVVLLNKKKYLYSYLKCILYDKLLNPRNYFE